MPDLTPEDIRHIARLARLEVPDGQVEQVRAELGAVLGYFARLGEMDLGGVAPLTHPGSGGPSPAGNRLDEDEPGPVLANDVAMGLAPDPMPPYFSVPRVLGDGGGA